MPKHLVNLDAMIARGDFESGPEPSQIASYDGKISLVLGELEQRRNTFAVLRKPDFQRETKEWKPEMVVEIIKNFLDRELIPAIILWSSPSRLVYVVDGAHRLSALIAWVNDDYGNGALSQKLFGANNIPKAQRATDILTREMVREEIQSYAFLSDLPNHPENGTTLQNLRSRGLSGAVIETQTITNPDPEKAEASFYRINQGGAVINDEEKEIIRARRWPQAIAARALLRAGTGHSYWKKFEPPIRAEIESLAKECFNALYEPELPDTFRTLDLPIAGRGYTCEALGLLYQFIHIANDITREPAVKRGKRKEFTPLPKNDPNADDSGQKVIEYLRRAKGLAFLTSSKDRGSLGLHPAVYTYTATGKFLTSAFFAQVNLVTFIKNGMGFLKFCELRCKFEDFLVSNKHFINRIAHDFGAGMRSADPLLELYREVLAGLQSGMVDTEIVEKLKKNNRLGDSLLPQALNYRHTKSTAATRRAKTEAKVIAALASADRCPLCGARMHPEHVTIDHIKHPRYGGTGKPDNLQPVHPFCNSGYKEYLDSQT